MKRGKRSKTPSIHDPERTAEVRQVLDRLLQLLAKEVARRLENQSDSAPRQVSRKCTSSRRGRC